MIRRCTRVSLFNQANGPLLIEFAEALVQAGATCTVCIGRDWAKKGQFSPEVIIQPAPALDRTSTGSRLFSWFAYLLRAGVSLLRCNASERVMLFSNPPLLPFLGWICSLIRRFEYSVVVYDIYPDIMTGMGMVGEGHPLGRLWRALNRVAYDHAFAVITLGDVMAAALARQFSPARTTVGRILISRPWVDVAAIVPRSKAGNAFATLHGQTGCLTVLYSGNMGATHDMETILGAARLMTEVSAVRFLLIGAGTGYAALVREAQVLKNVSVLPWQPPDQVPLIWSSAEIALVTLRPGIEQCSFPSKTAAALSAGCAIVGITNTPSDLADIIVRTGCGVVVSPGDAGQLAECLTMLAADPAKLDGLRKHARKAAEELFDSAGNIAAMLAGVPGGANVAGRG